MPFQFSGKYTLLEVLERGWELRIRCACGRHATWSEERCLQRFAGALDAPVSEIARRLTCSCGSPDGTITTVAGRPVDGMAHEMPANHARNRGRIILAASSIRK